MDLEMETPTQEVLSKPQENGVITPTGTWQSKRDIDLRCDIVDNM